MEEIPKYLCMDCLHYRECNVNNGIMCDFVKESKVTYIERTHTKHILVSKCDRFVERDSILDIPKELMEVITKKEGEIVNSKLNKIALEHGLDNQLEQTIEECSELILAIQKYKRYKKNNADFDSFYICKIAEEVVDVDIMVNQLKILIEGFDFEKFTDHQIERELNRMR